MSATSDESPVFTIRRHLDAPPDRVFAAFIDPPRLEQWFVVDGFQTPAERLRSTPQPGGGVEAVMVSDADGSEILKRMIQFLNVHEFRSEEPELEQIFIKAVRDAA